MVTEPSIASNACNKAKRCSATVLLSPNFIETLLAEQIFAMLGPERLKPDIFEIDHTPDTTLNGVDGRDGG